MAGYSSAGVGAAPFIDAKIAQRKVILFTKQRNQDSEEVKEVLSTYKLPEDIFEICEIESRQDCNQIENYFQVLCQTNSRIVSIYISKYLNLYL